MVQDQGLDVHLAPFGDVNNRYLEHSVPARSYAFTGDSNEVYIEAVDGERFDVLVDLLPDFDSRGAKHLRITLDLDSSNGTSGCVIYRDLKDFKGQKPKHLSLLGRHTFEKMIRKVGGAWSTCAFSFLPLKTDENLKMADKDVAREVKTLGKVVVTISRGHRKAEHLGLYQGNHAPDIGTSSEKVIGGNSVSHAVKHEVIGKATHPHKDNPARDWAGLEGQDGDPVEFTILYRSRDALEHIGILPRDTMFVDLTDSPPTSPKIKLEDGVDSVANARGIAYASDGVPIKREYGGSAVDKKKMRKDWTTAAAKRQQDKERDT